MHTVRTRIPQEQGITRKRRKRWRDWWKHSRVGQLRRVLRKLLSEVEHAWVKERKAEGKGSWLHILDDPDKALTELLEFMAARCFVHNNHQSIVRGYLAANNFFHKIFAGWELPMSHCMIVAVGKWIV